MLSSRRGYTLIELVVVVLVTAMLASVMFPHFVGKQNRAREDQVKENARMVQRVVETWASENEGRIPTLGELDPGLFRGGVYPPNPFSEEPTVIASPAFSPGNIGYTTAGAVYTIEGYGAEGIVITLTNG